MKNLSTVILLSILPVVEAASQSTVTYDTLLYNDLEFRLVGPFRGGRSAAVTGVDSNPFLYYFGGTGGGVWKTEDAGQTWENISDGYFGGSIGAVAVSEWDPNVIYVGGGEKTVRGNVSHGYGMWKSTDAGRTWKHAGLSDSRRIPRVRIHPRDPDLVYAAVLGHLFGPNEQRGVFRSKDGGETWERVLYVSDEVGAVDLVLDPTNPRILYASMWRVKRTPYSLESGGEGSGLWKSTDGGDSWSEITRNEGLPKGLVGIIGVTVSGANPDRVWAIVEAEDGGVFRSENGGTTWTRINEERKLRQRAWYYSRIYADPNDEDRLWVVNVGLWRSKDGGKSFERVSTPHGDHHDLWIAPSNSERLIVGDDGGAQVSLNGGERWSTYHNQPTSQFYRVTTDYDFPYRIYGAQQDNSTVRILHRSDEWTISERHWEPTAGGESGHLAPHPLNPAIVYGGSYGGYLTRLNHATGERRAVNVWPDDPLGRGADDLRYRFQWNFPIFFSPHNPDILYAAGNVLFRTDNEGQTWQAISPDLTRNDSTTLRPSGGPITKDNTGVEVYATIFAALESPHEPDVIWAGSDDGLLHITRNGGISWEDVTPPTQVMPEWTMINSIEAHPTEPGGLYVAATRYKLDDFQPYLYKTTDYGANWVRITDGIAKDHFTRVVRADPKRPGLLYAGTESGLYISFDDGQSWSPFQLNLPVVPITDLALKDDDLIVATQGRSFWVLDDVTPLHQLSERVADAPVWLYDPSPTHRLRGGRTAEQLTVGQNPPAGVVIRYLLREEPDSSEVAIRILNEGGGLIETFTPKAEKEGDRVAISAGMNTFVWDTRYPDAEDFDGLILWAGGLQGPKAVPGTYRVRLVVGEDSIETDFEILIDPRSKASVEDYAAQFSFLEEIRDKLTDTHNAIRQIRDLNSQIGDVVERTAPHDSTGAIKAMGDSLISSLTDVEQKLYQTKNKSPQDPLNYPIRLNNRLSSLVRLVSAGEFPPTDNAIAVKDELVREIDEQLGILDGLVERELSAFNELVREAEIPAVILPSF